MTPGPDQVVLSGKKAFAPSAESEDDPDRLEVRLPCKVLHLASLGTHSAERPTPLRAWAAHPQRIRYHTLPCHNGGGARDAPGAFSLPTLSLRASLWQRFPEMTPALCPAAGAGDEGQP